MLDGKVAIITGASKGIGRVMSQQFAREGARVVCNARSAELVKETVRLVEKFVLDNRIFQTPDWKTA